MRIGFDGKRAVCNNTGLGNYSRLVVDLLAEYYPDNEYLLYTPKIRENSRLNPIQSKGNVKLISPASGFSKRFGSLWRQWGIISNIKSDEIDLYHGLSGELPLNIKKSNIPSIVTIHDVIFRHFPEYYNPIDVKIYDYKFRKACENATRVMAISECTKRDVMNFYGIDGDKIDVVYQGCDESFNNVPSIEELNVVKTKYNLPDKFILYVGTIEERKNLMLVLRSLDELPQDIHVVAIGRKTDYFNNISEYINEANLSGRVKFLHDVPFSDLPKIYRMARVFVYPSRFEGFGIPMLEALCSGVPAIGATGSCLEEAGGPHSLYVNPDDHGSLTEAIQRILADSKLRETMIAEGYNFAKKFSKESIARNIMQIYEKVFRN